MNPLGRLGHMELSQVFSLLFQGVLLDTADVPCMPMPPGAPCMYLGFPHASFWWPLGPQGDPQISAQTPPRDPLETSQGPLETRWGFHS